MGRKRKQINIEIGRQVRKYREAAGLTREAFAEKAEISPQFCSSLENGITGISLTTLRRICVLFGVSADDILWPDRIPAQTAASQIEAMLLDTAPDLMPMIVENLRGQVVLIRAAQKAIQNETDAGTSVQH